MKQTSSHRRFNAGAPVTEEAYQWGREELARRDEECRNLTGYSDYKAMKKRWERRETEFGISSSVRKQVFAAAEEEMEKPVWMR